MLKLHTADGATTKIDLEDEAQAKHWLRKLGDPRFQATITGVTISHLGVQYSIPRPVGFDPIVFLAEVVPVNPEKKLKGGERISCLAGDVRATVMVHKAQRAARVSLFRLGKQRFNPLSR